MQQQEMEMVRVVVVVPSPDLARELLDFFEKHPTKESCLVGHKVDDKVQTVRYFRSDIQYLEMILA